MSTIPADPMAALSPSGATGPSAPASPPDGTVASSQAGSQAAGEQAASAEPAAVEPAVAPIPPIPASPAANLANDAVPPSAATPLATATPLDVSMRRGSIALCVLTALAVLYALHVARDFIVPVVVAIIIAYLLDPLVAALQRYRIPRPLGATLVLALLLGAVGWMAYLMQDQIASIVDRLPEIAKKLSRSLGALLSGDDSMWQKIRRAASVLAGTGQPPPTRSAQVVVERGNDPISHALIVGSVGAFAFAAQAVVIFFLSFFLLAAGDMFKRKFIRMVGTTLSQKKINVHMLDEINLSIQRYMAMLLITNVALGVLTWLMLTYLGVQNAGTWAVAAGALHLIPYFGSALIAVCLGVAVFMQFGTWGVAAIAMGGSLVIATIIGSVVTTWMTGRMAKMNAVAVFVALLLFTWLWGAWGMLLAIPIAVIVKVVADHIEGLELVAEFLGE